MKEYIKKYPISLFLVVAIWIICLIPIPETPLDNVPMIDKWTHFVMYGLLCSVIFAEYANSHIKPNIKRLAICGVLLPVIMGGLIELAQAYCTGGNRSGDWIDWIANSIGVMIGTAIGSLVVYLRTKARKDI